MQNWWLTSLFAIILVEWPDEIDFARAEEARSRAERRLASHEADLDAARAEAALKRAMVRLKLKH